MQTNEHGTELMEESNVEMLKRQTVTKIAARLMADKARTS
jgi:hypothetical protein